MVIIKFFLLDVLAFVSIGCISCTNKKGAEMKIVHTTQEKDSISSSLCKKIGIPEDMILPINSQGMDSLMKVYQTSYLQEGVSKLIHPLFVLPLPCLRYNSLFTAAMLLISYKMIYRALNNLYKLV